MIGTVGYFAAIVLAALQEGAGGYRCLRRSPSRPDLVLPPRGARAASGGCACSSWSRGRAACPGRRERDRRRAGLREAVESAAEGGRANVLVVSPALNSPLKHWTSDEDQARAVAEERLQRSLRSSSGSESARWRGRRDPLQAIEDALRAFGADVIVISTHPEGRSNWLERGSSRPRGNASRCRSRTSSSISTPKPPGSRPVPASCRAHGRGRAPRPGCHRRCRSRFLPPFPLPLPPPFPFP